MKLSIYEDELKLEHEAVKAEEKIKKTIPETSIPFREHQKYEYNEVKEPRIITSVDDIEDEAFEEVPDWQAGVELDTAPLAAEPHCLPRCMSALLSLCPLAHGRNRA